MRVDSSFKRKHQIIGIFMISVIVGLAASSLFLFGEDNPGWFQSFFFIALGFTLTFDAFVDFMLILITDILIPNMISPAVLYAKRICEGLVQNVCSATYSLDNYESFSSSRYLHASHFYADCVEFSIEKVFVMSYINPFPGRAGLSHNEASFSTPIGRLLISICSLVPKSLQRLMIIWGSSLGLVLVFLKIALISSFACYCFAALLLLMLFVIFFFGGNVNDQDLDHRQVYPEPLSNNDPGSKNMHIKMSSATDKYQSDTGEVVIQLPSPSYRIDVAHQTFTE